MSKILKITALPLLLVLLVAGCAIEDPAVEPASTGFTESAHPAGQEEEVADVSYTLKTSPGEGGLAFIGVGGDIDGVENPTLQAEPGDTVAITVINGDGLMHDLTIDEFDVTTGSLASKDESVTVTFTVPESGVFSYYCSVAGHRQAGMEGLIQVGEAVAQVEEGQNIARPASDVPEPVGDREPELVRVELTAQEVTGQLADGTTYDYFTFNGAVPGPMVRVRLGDTVELSLKNEDDSQFMHSIDLHAVNGPHGGGGLTQAQPGEEKVFTFKPLAPGLYVYHCATPSVPHHITNGMYGLILVEPEGGLPAVDREFYVMQGEMYTEQSFGERGHATFDSEKMSHETPEYYVFNGASGALTLEENALRAEAGETVRIFFGVGGPNKSSSFHVIGEIFDRAYSYGSLTSQPLTDVQTVLVPPGGAWMVEFEVEVPGSYVLVDHALSRSERGLAGHLIVDGAQNPQGIFHEGSAE